MKNFFLFVFEVVKIVIIALLIVIPIRYFIFQPFFVRGQSMEPTFESGDYLIVDEISYRFRSPQRGDIIVFKYPNDISQRYIKRIIALPGETVEIKDNKVIISNSEGTQTLDESAYLSSSVETYGDTRITLNSDEYFAMGDNRASSSDSRRWGPVPKEDVIGRVFVRAWPIVAFAKFEAPVY